MDKKDLIVQSALLLFSTHGFKATSVRDIATHAGVNVALINYYFGSKEGLFEKVIEFKASFLKDKIQLLVEDNTITPIEKIELVVDHLIDRKFSNRGFHRLLHRELSEQLSPEMQETISDILLRNLVSIKAFIQEGIDKKMFRDVDIELTLATMIGTIHYLVSSEIMARKILGKKRDFNPFTNKKLKQRLSAHVKQMMRAHLLK